MTLYVYDIILQCSLKSVMVIDVYSQLVTLLDPELEPHDLMWHIVMLQQQHSAWALLGQAIEPSVIYWLIVVTGLPQQPEGS